MNKVNGEHSLWNSCYQQTGYFNWLLVESFHYAQSKVLNTSLKKSVWEVGLLESEKQELPQRDSLVSAFVTVFSLYNCCVYSMVCSFFLVLPLISSWLFVTPHCRKLLVTPLGAISRERLNGLANWNEFCGVSELEMSLFGFLLFQLLIHFVCL